MKPKWNMNINDKKMSNQTLKKCSSGHNKPGYLKNEINIEASQEYKLTDLMEIPLSIWKERRSHIVNDESKRCEFE